MAEGGPAAPTARLPPALEAAGRVSGPWASPLRSPRASPSRAFSSGAGAQLPPLTDHRSQFLSEKEEREGFQRQMLQTKPCRERARAGQSAAGDAPSGSGPAAWVSPQRPRVRGQPARERAISPEAPPPSEVRVRSCSARATEAASAWTTAGLAPQCLAVHGAVPCFEPSSGTRCRNNLKKEKRSLRVSF